MIKKTTVLLLLAFMGLSAFVTSSKSDEVNFIEEDYQAAINQAKAEDKLVYVFVYGGACQASSKMLGKTFSDPKVAKFFNDNFVCLKLSADEFKNNLRITNWGLYGVPANVFVNSQRKVVLKVNGYKDPANMLGVGEAALEKK